MINIGNDPTDNILIGDTQVDKVYLGTDVVWEHEESIYDAEVDYLEGSGTQYINTGINANSAYSIEITLLATKNNGGMAIGARTSKGAYTDHHIGYPDPGHIRFKNHIGICVYDIDLNTFYTVKLYNNELYYNGVKQTPVSTDPAQYSPFTLNIPYYIFACNTNGSASIGNYMRIRSVVIRDTNNKIIFDAYAVRKRNVGYFYDKITGTLLGNAGTGNFALGSDITSQKRTPIGYTDLEYISSTKTGNQYIDLDIKLYETLNVWYDIAMKFIIVGQGTGNNTNAAIFACQDPASPYPGTFVRMPGGTGKGTVVGRYIGGNKKDNTIGRTNDIIELPVQTPPNKNVTNLSNSNRTHSYGTSLLCVFSDLNNTAINFTEGTIYYFKLFIEGVLVRDMVPCRNPNNVVGLYDTVNEVFYSSPNGAAFIAGPEI